MKGREGGEREGDRKAREKIPPTRQLGRERRVGGRDMRERKREWEMKREWRERKGVKVKKRAQGH